MPKWKVWKIQQKAGWPWNRNLLSSHLRTIFNEFLLWLFFPYTIQETPWGTYDQTLWHAQTAERTGKPLFGNKAFSPLLCVVGVPTKVLLDYMHLMLASEFLRRLNIWFDHQSDNGFLAECKDEVDVALLNVKFSHDFNRKLRLINELEMER